MSRRGGGLPILVIIIISLLAHSIWTAPVLDGPDNDGAKPPLPPLDSANQIPPQQLNNKSANTTTPIAKPASPETVPKEADPLKSAAVAPPLGNAANAEKTDAAVVPPEPTKSALPNIAPTTSRPAIVPQNESLPKPQEKADPKDGKKEGVKEEHEAGKAEQQPAQKDNEEETKKKSELKDENQPEPPVDSKDEDVKDPLSKVDVVGPPPKDDLDVGEDIAQAAEADAKAAEADAKAAEANAKAEADEELEARDQIQQLTAERQRQQEEAVRQLELESADGHFMWWMIGSLTLVVLLYLAFHQKRFLLALLIEGRRAGAGSTRRAGSGPRYKRVGTTDVEAEHRDTVY